jgi:hypothetical protein
MTHVKIGLVMVAVCLGLWAPAAQGQSREFLGHGRLISNDLFGDTADRWNSGSAAASRVRGPAWSGMLPDRPFSLLEYRIGARVAAPANLRDPAPGDRPFAAALALGLHTHFARGETEIALGTDLAFTGPQTGLDRLQTALHDAFGYVTASDAVLDDQVGNAVHPSMVMEAGRSFGLGDRTVLRPYTELRWGLETLARLGADVTIGPVGQGELLVRDPVTGQRYRTVHRRVEGLSLVFGGDLAAVSDSALLPADKGVRPTDTRTRLRAGVHWQGARNAAFYGLTWMSEEFTAQPKGQLIGSMRLQLRF